MLLQNYLPYFFIYYYRLINFLIDISPYSPLAKKIFQVFSVSGQFEDLKMLNLWGSEHSPNCHFLGALFTVWCCVANAVLSQK